MIARCSICKRAWNISTYQKIGPAGYICPHCVMEPAMTRILQKASENPEYQAIANYLMSRRSFPEMQFNENPSSNPSYLDQLAVTSYFVDDQEDDWEPVA